MDIHVRLQVRPSGAEVSVTTGPIYMKLADSLLGHFLALRYDHTANAWQFFLDTGGATVNIPQSFVDAYFGCNFHAIPQADGTVVINVYHANTFWGVLTTPTGWAFDTFLIGGIDNTSNEAINHHYTGVTIGTTPGGSDIMAWVIQSSHPLPSPFDEMVGGTFTAEYPTSEIHVVNSGDSNAYLKKQWTALLPPPPPPPSGDAHVIIVGNSGWEWSSQPAWILDSWGLDRLVISMRGSRLTKDAFLATLIPWMPCPIDSNMFLSNVTQEQRGSSNFPQIDITYTGKRGGTLPPNREQQGEQVQQISARAIWNFAHTVNLTFIGTTSEQTVWSRAPIDLSTVNPLEPSAIELMWLVETDAIIWAGTWEAYLAIIETNVNMCFVSRLVWTGVSEELVPGQYYRATRTMQRLYFPVMG